MRNYFVGVFVVVLAMVSVCFSCSSAPRDRLMPVPYPAGGGFGGGIPFIGGGHFGRRKRFAGQQQQQENKFHLVETEYACVQECMREAQTPNTAADGMFFFEKCQELCSSAEKMWRDGLSDLLFKERQEAQDQANKQTTARD